VENQVQFETILTQEWLSNVQRKITNEKTVTEQMAVLVELLGRWKTLLRSMKIEIERFALKFGEDNSIYLFVIAQPKAMTKELYLLTSQLDGIVHAITGFDCESALVEEAPLTANCLIN
jgi:hypothetical protein